MPRDSRAVWRRLANADPIRMIAGSALVPLLLVPICVAALMEFYGAAIGDLTLTITGGQPRTIDSRWVFPISGLLGMAMYLILAIAGYALFRRSSLLVRNLVSLALVPVSLAGFSIAVTGPA